MLHFACPFCHFHISVEESDAGGRILCPACGKTVAIPSTRFDNGCIIGDFIIQNRIGAGSAGTVYLAQQISLEREVALKVLSHKNMTEKGVTTFLNEARAAAKLSHVNLVQSYAQDEGEVLLRIYTHGSMWMPVRRISGRLTCGHRDAGTEEMTCRRPWSAARTRGHLSPSPRVNREILSVFPKNARRKAGHALS